MDFQFSVTTEKDVATAAADVEKSLAERKFMVLWSLDMNEKLKEKGLSTATEFRVLEVCNAGKAKEALDTNPLVGYFLPCKVVVYRRPGEATRLGLVRPSALIGFLDDPSLNQLAGEVEATLSDALTAAR